MLSYIMEIVSKEAIECEMHSSSIFNKWFKQIQFWNRKIKLMMLSWYQNININIKDSSIWGNEDKCYY